MVTIVKHEWHSHDRQYAIELDESLLGEIYPDLDENEIAEKLQQIADGEVDPDEIFSDAYDNDVEIEWDFQYDDCWTDRKGGYDVTYELGDEDSWVEPEKEPDPTHKCTKCRWTGSRWNTLTQYLREDGSAIEDYYNTEEESHSEKEVCPMCDSAVELTEAGIVEERERQEREAQWALDAEEEDELDDDERRLDLEEALAELKRDFESLTMADQQPQLMKCIKCSWTGDWMDTDNDDDGNTCPECGSPVEDVDKTD